MRFLLLLVAAVIAVIAGAMVLQLTNKNTALPAPVPVVAAPAESVVVPTVDVLVARVPVAAGTRITEDMLDTQPWPENLVLKDFIVKGSPGADVVGKVARSAFQARETLISSKLANANDSGFLAAHLPAGMRAVTIATDVVSGVAGFVYPGDHVDVLFTHNIPGRLAVSPAGGVNNGDKPAYAEVLIPNAIVLAINLRDAPARDDGQKAALPAAVTPTSVTLQVSVADAENIRLAEKAGTLSVALRSLQDAATSIVVPPADLAGLTHANSEQAPQAIDDSVTVIRK